MNQVPHPCIELRKPISHPVLIHPDVVCGHVDRGVPVEVLSLHEVHPSVVGDSAERAPKVVVGDQRPTIGVRGKSRKMGGPLDELVGAAMGKWPTRPNPWEDIVPWNSSLGQRLKNRLRGFGHGNRSPLPTIPAFAMNHHSGTLEIEVIHSEPLDLDASQGVEPFARHQGRCEVVDAGHARGPGMGINWLTG